MSHLQVLGLVLAVMAVIYAFYWLVCRLLDRAVKNQPPRVAVPDDGTALDGANDFFRPRAVASTALAATRIAAPRNHSNDTARG